MTRTPIILDTCALRDRDFVRWLRDYRGRKVLPTVAYAELLVFFIGTKGRTKEEVRRWLTATGIEIEPMTPFHAEKGAENGIAGGDFHDHAMDYLIGAHAHTPPLVMVTNNKKDFGFLGSRVWTPEELRKRA